MAWQKTAGRGEIIFRRVAAAPERFPLKLAVLITRGFLGKVRMSTRSVYASDGYHDA